MRKKTQFVFAFILVFFQFCSCASTKSDTKTELIDNVEQNFVEDEISNLPFYIDSSLELNSNLFSIHHPIEESYIDEITKNAGNTASLLLLYNKYEKLWEEELKKYQELIENELCLSNDALDAFQLMMEQWYAGIDDEVSFFSTMEFYLHEDGTIISPNISRYTMNLYRAQTLKLICIYEELMVGQGWSWKGQVW